MTASEGSGPASRRPARRPTLYASNGGERRATWLELFFDLVFVLAVAELAHFLHDHATTLDGFLGFAALFVPVWWAWMGFTYWADTFDADGPAYRASMLVAMLLSVALAVNVHGAFDGGSAGFAGAFLALQVLLVGLYVWAWHSSAAARPLCSRYIGGFSLGALIWLASLLAPEPARYALWALALLVEVATPVVAYATVARAPVLQASHLPERLGLFTIVVLGEAVVVTGAGVADTDWAVGSALVAVFGFVAVACLWWLYFDRIDESAVERAYAGGARELVAGFVWGYVHLAVFAGLTAVAVGIELAIGEASEGALGGGARAALCGGAACYLLAISAIHPLSPSPFPKGALAARLGAAAFAVLLAAVGAALAPPVLVGLLSLALLGLTVFEILRPDLLPTGAPDEAAEKDAGRA